MKLYRGDYIDNEKTNPWRFRGNGLTASSFWGKSDPNNIERIGFLDTIRKHIFQKNELDKKYYKATDYISFSRKEERAEFFCRGNKTGKLIPADDYTETRYIFEMDIDESLLEKLGEGIYSFSYVCNLDLRSSDSGDFFDSIYFTYLRQRHDECSICHNTSPNHRLMLIDAVTFLKSHASKEVFFDKEIKNATKDEEWLVLPLDPIDGCFRSCRIQRADFWQAKLYTMERDVRPEKCRESPGIII